MDLTHLEDVIVFVTNALPGFRPTGEARRLTGGNLNHVWRVLGSDGSLVVKYAPPYIAKAPDIPINPQRIMMEAAALRLFDSPPLLSIISEKIRPPRLIHADEKRHAIILEDLGPLPTLDEADKIEQGLGARLGTFLAQLHCSTAGNEALASALNNIDIQQSRLDVQYTQIGPLLENFGISNSAEPGRKARKLGEKYLAKGKCLIMGDLWPRSVLAGPQLGQARIIDWEFAHYGRPAQDVAHFLAHLWMLQHRSGSEEKSAQFRQLSEAFTKNYMAEISQEKPGLFDEEEREDAGIHFGAEILARTLGSFQNSYLYHGLPHSHPAIREAVAEAMKVLDPEFLIFDF